MTTQAHAAHARAERSATASTAAMPAGPAPDLETAMAFLVHHGQSVDWVLSGDPLGMTRAVGARKFVPSREKLQGGCVDEAVAMLASDNDHAKAAFEPWAWDGTKGPFRPGPSRDFTDSLGLAARIAYAIMYRSKPELVEGARDTTIESVADLMQLLQMANDDLRQMADVVSAAMSRLISAHAVVALEEG